MGKTLIVAEKPSVAADIANALGGFTKTNGVFERADAVVSHAVGHLVEMFSQEAEDCAPTLESLPLIPTRFGLRPTKNGYAQLSKLVQLIKDPSVTEIVNACDAGREGELIFRLIYDYSLTRKTMRRMWLQSMTKDGILEAWNNVRPGEEFQGLGDAAFCRSEADWIMGINGTRGVTQLYLRKSGSFDLMNVGRVQTPTLNLVVERENQILNFVPKDFWEVRGSFGVAAGSYQGTWVDLADKQNSDEAGDADEPEEGSAAVSEGQRIFDKARADALVAKCQGVAPSKVTEESKLTEEAPQKLFDLTTLQREANKRFKFSAKKTLDIAQALYETHKVTTYPRTDSSALPEDYVGTVSELMGKFTGAYATLAQAVIDGGWVTPNKRIFDNAAISDHFAIIPTGTAPSSLSEDEKCIYDLIVRRFIAAFYPSAKYEVTTRLTFVSEETFRTRGKVQKDAGWRAVWASDAKKADGTSLCFYTPGEVVSNQAVKAFGGQTKPPSRFNEASLLGAMEKAGKSIDDSSLRAAIRDCGLGTPATRAATIEGLLSKGTPEKPRIPYMTREGKEQHLVPSEKGLGLCRFLIENSLSSLTSAEMTAQWETRLQQVQKGTLKRREFMDGIADSAKTMIGMLKEKAASLPDPMNRVFPAPCPKCAGELRGHKKIECVCGFTIWKTISSRAMSDLELTDLLTKKKTELLQGFVSSKKKTKFDAYLLLSDDFSLSFEFPQASSPSAGGAKPQALKASCPKCRGEVQCIGGTHPRYACSKCDFKIWGVVAGRKLSETEAETLIRDGILSPRQGFISSKKTKFAAGLRLSPDFSKVEFFFENK